jgi:uncharacterized protein with LGFP repeats
MSSGLSSQVGRRVILSNASRIGAQRVSGGYRPIISPIDLRHQELGGSLGLLGSPLNDQRAVNGGMVRDYENGSIYWSRSTGAFEVHGAIRDKWRALGAEQSFLGFPVTDESKATIGEGRFNGFQGGVVYWSAATGAFEIHGDILNHWRATGGERLLGFPTSDETRAEGDRYRFSNFEHGQIAWSPHLGAHISATTLAAVSSGAGLRIQDVSGGQVGFAAVRRKVVCHAAMNIQDHENFGSNEHAAGERNNETVLTSDNPAQVMEFVMRMGGEIRVELRVNAQVLLSGDVRVQCRADLFEGTSENTDDLDGVEEHTFIVPRDGSVSPNFRVRNTDEGDDDFADISLHLVNSAA